MLGRLDRHTADFAPHQIEHDELLGLEHSDEVDLTV